MSSQLPVVLDLAKAALMLGLIVAAPLLGVALLVGLAASLLQALTQVHEATVGFVPKLVVGAVAALALLPWMLSRLSEFAVEVFGGLAYR